MVDLGKEVIGQKYGRWEVLAIGEKPRHLLCRCTCGTVREVYNQSLKACKSLSCGCKAGEESAKRFTTHGESRSNLYNIYITMLDRCLNPKSQCFDRYGGRGITISPTWLGDSGYINFKADMSPTFAPGLTLERNNNNEGYCKENCSWATRSEQSRNKGKHKNNSSGFTGVSEREDGFVAYCSASGKRNTKYFSKSRYGAEMAYKLAVECRINMIKRLCEIGEVYKEGHGL